MINSWFLRGDNFTETALLELQIRNAEVILTWFSIVFNSALQELHNMNLHVERLQDLLNFQINILQQKSEKAEGENSDMSEVLVLKTEQVSAKMEM